MYMSVALNKSAYAMKKLFYFTEIFVPLYIHNRIFKTKLAIIKIC